MRKYFLLGFLLFFSLFFLGCKKTSNTTNSASQIELLSGDSAQALESLNNNLAQAKEAAKGWKNNAQFTAIVLKITPETKTDNLTETFVFGSPDDSQNWWTYSITPTTDKVVRSLTPKEDYLGTNFQPIQETYLKISYIEALNSAETDQGVVFRANNPNYQIGLVLGQTAPKNWLWWQVEYQSADSFQKILVNASDGQIYDENGNPISS